MSPILLRPVVPADIPALAALRAVNWESKAYWRERISLYLSGEHSPQHALRERAAFAAISGDQIAGFVAGHRTRRFACDGELQWIDVLSGHRRRGIGSALVREMGLWFLEQGARRICVNVEPENEAARRMYARSEAKAFRAFWMVWEDSRLMLGQIGMNSRETR